jgi:uncharacterized protein YebE (UPF0316 family)
MELLAAVPVWLLAPLVFVLRICDVTLGTVRTVSIVKGRVGLSVILGFFEVSIWITAVAQVIARLDEAWYLGFAYAAGFAAGNGIGILVERRLALGTSVVRILSHRRGDAIAKELRSRGHAVTTFSGEGFGGDVTLVYAVAPRRYAREMIADARSIDPDALYVTEPAHESSFGTDLGLRAIAHPTGWRAVFKKK